MKVNYDIFFKQIMKEWGNCNLMDYNAFIIAMEKLC